MSLVVLIDLDDTLLSNDMSVFLPAYFQELNAKFSLTPQDLLPKASLAASEGMVRNQFFNKTLEEVFNQHFYPLINSSPDFYREIVNDFYRDNYTRLRFLTNPMPGASALIETCITRGYSIAIATNPLFPKTAVNQRVSWSGIDPNHPAIKLISNFEDFHFAKPHLAYYLEILCHLGWPERAVMIGNDLKDDIVPADKLGLPTYWIENHNAHDPPLLNPLRNKGSLDGVITWLDSIEQKVSPINYSTPEVLIASLNAAPAFLDTFFRQIPEIFWRFKSHLDEWAPVEILCHFRDVDLELNLPRVFRVLKDPGAFIPVEKIDHYANERKYLDQDPRNALNDFFASRTKLIDVLSRLDENEWRSPAWHSIYGRISLVEMVELMLNHDQNHTRQFSEAVAQGRISQDQ